MPRNLRLNRLAGWLMVSLMGSGAIGFSAGAHAAARQQAPHHRAAAPAHTHPHPHKLNKAKPAKAKSASAKSSRATPSGSAHASKGARPAKAAARSARSLHAKKASAGANAFRVAKAARGAAHARQDLSGHKRVGKASFYASKLEGRKMADGTRMRLHDDNAASKTLPLGTTARVTNLENGKSAQVTIQDRGPYAKDRIVDLSPATARKIGIDPRDGVATVQVEPLTLPKADGSARQGNAADKSASSR